MRLIGLAVVLVLIVASCVAGPNRTPNAYRIEPADYLWISVSNNDAMSRSAVVRSDGKISLPLINDVQAAGSTPFELRGLLRNKFKDFIPSPEVDVYVIDVQSFKVCTKEPTRPGCDDIERLAKELDYPHWSGRADKVTWVEWRWAVDHSVPWKPVRSWPTREECERNLPRYAVPEDETLLVNAIRLGWHCYENTYDPRRPDRR